MKNTLAENMLRFGVKNLSESDVKRIQESLTEAPAQGYQPFAELGTPTLTFKSEAIWQSLISKPDLGVVIPNFDTNKILKNPEDKETPYGTYGAWTTMSSQDGYRREIRSDLKLVAAGIVSSLVLMMIAQNYRNHKVYTNFEKAIAQSYNVSRLLGQKLGSDVTKPAQYIGNPAWGLVTSKNSSDPNRQGFVTQRQWEATLAILGPIADAVISQNTIAPPTAKAPVAATPGMTPKSTPTLGKQ
jgi:hypothetical protein